MKKSNLAALMAIILMASAPRPAHAYAMPGMPISTHGYCVWNRPFGLFGEMCAKGRALKAVTESCSKEFDGKGMIDPDTDPVYPIARCESNTEGPPLGLGLWCHASVKINCVDYTRVDPARISSDILEEKKIGAVNPNKINVKIQDIHVRFASENYRSGYSFNPRDLTFGEMNCANQQVGVIKQWMEDPENAKYVADKEIRTFEIKLVEKARFHDFKSYVYSSNYYSYLQFHFLVEDRNNPESRCDVIRAETISEWKRARIENLNPELTEVYQ